MRITIVTDAWIPQVNGVVRTLHEVSPIVCEAREPAQHIFTIQCC